MSNGIARELTIDARGLRYPAVACGDGPVVVLLHGFPDTYRSFDQQLPILAEAGYRAVSVSMRGYDPGNQPADRDFSQKELAADAVAVAEALASEPVHLVGHDWGAAVSYTAAAMAPQKFKSLTTMAVPHSGRFLVDMRRHPRQLRLSWYMGFFQLPAVPERILRRNDFAFLRWLWRQWSPTWDFSCEDFAPVAECFAQPQVVECALAYYRAAVDLPALFGMGRAPAILNVPVPTLAMTGSRDGCISSDVFEAMSQPKDFPAGLEVKRVDGAGHFLHRERPDVVNAALLAWLAAHA
ncbi:MAG: alpha/beta hydrolase [Pseudomonadota bacterium]